MNKVEQQKGIKSWYLKLVFSLDRPKLVWAARWGFHRVSLLPTPTVPSQRWPNNHSSHEYSLGLFLKEAFSENPRGPEGTRGSFGSSSDQQDVRLVTCGQGIRESCTHGLPPATGPAGKPSLPVAQLPTAEQSKKFISLRRSSVNAPFP